MKLSSLSALTVLSCAAAGLSHVSTVHACGGCFHGVTETAPSVVTAHRMALALSPTRTVLWDQVQYAGDPKEFAWVLPVGPGAYIEEADDAWFESLEAVTGTRVVSPTVMCDGVAVQESDGGGFGCGSSSAAGSSPMSSDGEEEGRREGDTDGVLIEHEGTVGPYETVTLKSDDPEALRNWLSSHGYAIPEDVEPIIDSYVAQQSSFIALRLKPGAGIRQMTPVRVITPGASPTLPLRMVTAGTGATVAIVLYVIAEGRYEAANFEPSPINFSQLSWDFSVSQSNYAQLRNTALKNGGFLTSFAEPQGMTAQVATPDGFAASFTVATQNTTYDNLTDLYFGQASIDANSCATIGNMLRAIPPGVAVAACDGACAPGQFDAARLECDGATDVATALLGMHPSDVWVTRLEANLPRAKLAMDLTLGASAAQAAIASWHVAATSIGSPCPDDGDDTSAETTSSPPPRRSSWLCAAGARGKTPLSNAAVSGLGGFALLFAARRALRRPRS